MFQEKTLPENDVCADAKALTSFEDMPLHHLLRKGIYSYGLEKPTAIQQRTIAPFILGGDIIVQSPSASGKTCALCIGLLQRVDFQQRGYQALVLSPTREVAHHTKELIGRIGDALAETREFCHTFVGGIPPKDDVAKVESGGVVAVGTPGRVCELIRRGVLHTDTLRTLVIEEADELLSNGYKEYLYEIIRSLPKETQIALFCATMPNDVMELTKTFMRTPTCILVKPVFPTIRSIRQYYVAVEDDHKLDVLMDLYDLASTQQTVIFVNNGETIDLIADRIHTRNHAMLSLHAQLSMSERQQVVSTFRGGSSRVLATTDTFARGIAYFANVVINFDLPTIKENYMHRIGASGCYARKAIGINFVSQRDVELLREIEGYYEVKFENLPKDFVNYLQAGDGAGAAGKAECT